MTDKYRVQVLNHISAGGLKRLPWDRFAVSADVDDPHAILVRSADLRPGGSGSLLAVGRRGPAPTTSRSKAARDPGVQCPGANANAVKELVVAGMLLAARNIDGALKYLDSLDPDDPDLEGRSRPARRRSRGTSWGLHARDRGPRQDRLPGCRCGDQARHAGDRV